MSINRGRDKKDMECIYNEILLSHKKEWNNIICSNTVGPRDDHTKWSKSDKDKTFIHGIQKKNDTNELIYKTDLQTLKKNYGY